MSKGSLFAGIFSFLVCICVWTIVANFLTENELNPIQDALDEFFPKFEEFLFLQKNATIQEGKFNNETNENLRNYVEEIKVFCPTLITAILVVSVVYALSSVLMMIGTISQKTRGLMIPYIFLQLFFIILLIYNSFFLYLTMLLMPLDSRFSWGSFLMFISISISVLASMCRKIKVNALICIVIVYMVIVYFPLPTYFTFPEVYYGNIFASLATLHILFAMCLFLVLQDFTKNEIEPQDTK